MKDGHWIYVPTPDAERPWTGRIWNEGDQSNRWRFEMIRSGIDGDFTTVPPFQDAAPVIGLFDHQRPCTLVRPLITRVDNGKAGLDFPFLRTRIEGSCEALLTGLAVADELDEVFAGVGFESEAFSAWYSGRAFSTQRDYESRTDRIETSGAQREVVQVPGLGEVEGIRLATVQENHRSSVVMSRHILKVRFEKAQSLREVINLCLGLEFLFGFLAGFRPKPPAFNIWQTSAPQGTGTFAMDKIPPQAPEGKLEIGGVRWSRGDAPHPMRLIHRCDQGGIGLKHVLDAFTNKPNDYVIRIHAVEASRHFATTLNNKFAQAMPVFEEFLRSTFTAPDEVSYAAHEKTFFDWIEASQEESVREFAKKHVKVVQRKAPSLPQLIDRGLQTLRADGFRFPTPLAKGIASRRGAMFHSAPLMEENDVPAFYHEVRAITFALLLLTLKDLGIPVSTLIEEYHALSDYSDFLKEGPWERREREAEIKQDEDAEQRRDWSVGGGEKRTSAAQLKRNFPKI
ncbi:MAG: hypothetical protein ABW039_00590 [Sphingobium sp.]